MNITKFEAILVRFCKGFLSGGLGAVGALLAAGITLHSLTDLRSVGITLITAFISGGILALEKMLSWQPPQVPTPPVGSPES